MDIVLLLLRLTLACVFVVAGVAKLTDRAGTSRALLEFGVGPRFVLPGSILLPLIELVVALALIPPATARLGAIGALALLVLFTAAIVVNLRRGRRPDCRCFGQLHSVPVGRSTLARNTSLSVIAGIVALLGWHNPGVDPARWFHAETTTESLGAAATLVLIGSIGVVAWTRWRTTSQDAPTGTIERQDPGTFEPGDRTNPWQETSSYSGNPPASPFRLPGIDGARHTLDDLRHAGRPVLLVFTDPDCGTCNALMPEISRWQRDHASTITVAVISTGTLGANRAKALEHGVDTILIQDDWEVGDAYGAESTPSAALVRPDGTISGEIAAGRAQIRELVRKTVQPVDPAVNRFVANGNPARGQPAAGA